MKSWRGSSNREIGIRKGDQRHEKRRDQRNNDFGSRERFPRRHPEGGLNEFAPHCHPKVGISDFVPHCHPQEVSGGYVYDSTYVVGIVAAQTKTTTACTRMANSDAC